MYTSTSTRIRSSGLATVLAFSTALLSIPTNADTQDDVETRNKRIVTEAFDAWAAGGNTFFRDMLAPDMVWTIKGSGPSAGEYRGLDNFVEQAIRPFASRLQTPVRPVSKQVWADGDHVVIQWDGAGVAKDGQPYSNSYAWIFEMRNGKATEVTAYLDLGRYDDVLRRIPDPDMP
ncbi:nuclear transport factor 2 family protein [Stutzerimonas stutzeri]